MPVRSENDNNVQSLLEDLIATYETEVNYSPIERELNPELIKATEMATLVNFLNDKRKRLFIFKIPNNERDSALLEATARRAILNQTAEVALKSTSTEPQINPLKIALNDDSATVRANIQIQKSFPLPRPRTAILDRPVSERIEGLALNTVPVAIDLDELPILKGQLAALGMNTIDNLAQQKIKESPEAFTDGIIPNNLPKGFYIGRQNILCYTNNPSKLPSPLAPKLERITPTLLPTLPLAKLLLPKLPDAHLGKLLNSNDIAAQKAALIAVFSSNNTKEINAALNLLNADQAAFIIPFLAKLYILGGEAHTRLFIKLLQNCINKKLNIEFLKDPVAQESFLNPQGIKNLQKLLELPAEQKEWWNSLVAAHLKDPSHHFDFNTCFEAYTQIFLSRIAEKKLRLPDAGPLKQEGHFLITLNRIYDVLDLAKDPQEQCSALRELDWGPTGAHYAMTHGDKSQRLVQVSPCMDLQKPEDRVVTPQTVFEKIGGDTETLKTGLYRYVGRYWKAGIRLVDIQAQFDVVQKQASWSVTEKNQVLFILGCTFASESELNLESWQKKLKESIGLLQTLEPADRSNLLQALAKCYKFKPNPTLTQIHLLFTQLLEFKTAFPSKNFNDEIITPFLSCLENEGFDLINVVQERVQKVNVGAQNEKQLFLATLLSFVTTLQRKREQLSSNAIRLLALLDEQDLSEDAVTNFITAINTLSDKKGADYSDACLLCLSKINISKSQPLPKIQGICELINTLANAADVIPMERNTLEKREEWFKNHIIDKALLPGCVFGNGDISKLDGLIVDALVDAVKKRSQVLQIGALKEELKNDLQSGFVPQELRDQLGKNLFPVFDALEDLVNLLLSPEPKFEQILENLAFFEKEKPNLLNTIYNVGPILRSSKGEYILSLILTGKKHKDDDLTNWGFSKALIQLHGLIEGKIKSFFNNEQNRNSVSDVDANTCLQWLASFNQTHSLIFLFKEELVQKKVLPALKKTLQQLHTQDVNFENSILAEATKLAEDKSANLALQDYKTTIESIVSYLNFLIDIKGKTNGHQFTAIYRQLQTPPLDRLDYKQKQTLVNTLFLNKPESFDQRLKFIIQALEENPDADSKAINRAIDGLVSLFELADLESDTQTMFFNMSIAHNLRNDSPFPLGMLTQLKKSELHEEAKSFIIKQVIQILSRMTPGQSQEPIQNLVHQTETFLTRNPTQSFFCMSLLKLISLNNANNEIKDSYLTILSQLNSLNIESREKIITILTHLANNKKDASINLAVLLDIAQGLGRRAADLDRVKALFETPPYPIAQTLSSALSSHGSEKLQEYCSNFDTNPFAKNGQTRPFKEHFATDRIPAALLSLKDLLQGIDLSPQLQKQLARDLTIIETLGYTDPLNPNDYSKAKKLTATSRQDLKVRACFLLKQLRENKVSANEIKHTQIELLAYLREIYCRTTGLFPNTSQMLVLLIALYAPHSNLLERINTGEGKSLITPILAVLQWAQGGTVDVCTANRTLLARDYQNSCEPFFKFLDIKSALIEGNTDPKEYQLGGINCSTLEGMAHFRLTAKEAKKEHLVQNGEPIHLVLDECDDALLDQITLYKLVAENSQTDVTDTNAQWIYPLAYQFVNSTKYRNINPKNGKVWDEEEDPEKFRLFINKEIIEKFNGDADKQNFMQATTNTQLKQWLNATCKAAKLVPRRHFLVRIVQEKDNLGNEAASKMVCIPLVRSTPKVGCIFTDGIQQALQARLIAEYTEQERQFIIDQDPLVLSSQSAQGLVRFYQGTKGRLVGISGTPGDPIELQYLGAELGTQAIGIAPYAGDNRKKHPPVFTFSREETIRAIHEAISVVRRPVTTPSVTFNPNELTQTVAEKEAFILKKDRAQEEWNKTQTQPILIVSEDFDDAQTIGKSFKSYEDAGYTVQVVTGKETPEELEIIIRKAGQANTITIGTAMLARGIDVNPGNHPEGLFVIQTYADSKRMTTQIAGRAARNGKPGQWLPIYQLPPPQDWFTQVMYFLFPSYRQKRCEEAIEEQQHGIKLQATLDRLYTQAIDRAQQILMQQVEAWESLLLELYPNNGNLQYELYQWRQMLLSELTHAQETSITEETLDTSITQFQSALCKIWDKAREEKWVAKAQKSANFTAEQSIRFEYLKQLELNKELMTQAPLQQQAQLLQASSEELMHQSIEAIILDKAGAALEFNTPAGEAERSALEVEQGKQLLPFLIAEFCTIYPEALERLNLPEKMRSASFIPSIFSSISQRLIQQRNKVWKTVDTKQYNQAIVESFQNQLASGDANTLTNLFDRFLPLIINSQQNFPEISVVDKFKLQGLILTFSKLFRQSGLPQSELLDKLEKDYSNGIMGLLAHHILQEFSWTKQTPKPMHALLERNSAKIAAEELYTLAEEVTKEHSNEEKIHALYTGLQQYRLQLQDKYLFSVGHSSPRDVINNAIRAVEVLELSPLCNRAFQESCHDKVLLNHHAAQFRDCLETISKNLNDDAVWKYFKTKLMHMLDNEKQPIHLIEELSETVERFSNYSDYQTYRSEIKKLRSQLSNSMKDLRTTNKLKQNTQDSLFTQKAAELAPLFKVNADQIRIQNGCDGRQSYIEVQIRDNAPLQAGFTGYQSSSLTTLEKEKAAISQQLALLSNSRNALINLSKTEIDAITIGVRKEEFAKLLQLKEIEEKNWQEGLEPQHLKELPEKFQKIYTLLKRFEETEWLSEEEFKCIQDLTGLDFYKNFQTCYKEHHAAQSLLKELESQKAVIQQELTLSDNDTKKQNDRIFEIGSRMKNENPSFKEKISLGWEQLTIQVKKSVSSRATDLQRDLSSVEENEHDCRQNIKVHEEQYISEAQKAYHALNKQAKALLADHLTEMSTQCIDAYQQELNGMKASVEKLQAQEIKKSAYQKHRFFDSRELLNFEAGLRQERELIPKLPASETSYPAGVFGLFARAKDSIFSRNEPIHQPNPGSVT